MGACAIRPEPAPPSIPVLVDNTYPERWRVPHAMAVAVALAVAVAVAVPPLCKRGAGGIRFCFNTTRKTYRASRLRINIAPAHPRNAQRAIATHANPTRLTLNRLTLNRRASPSA
ncbi:hypothetical protein LC55x_3903 [Lysobacter capsici]|nr:hypothetical protein LC55x_3903 [Lysobacter capsici]